MSAISEGSYFKWRSRASSAIPQHFTVKRYAEYGLGRLVRRFYVGGCIYENVCFASRLDESV